MALQKIVYADSRGVTITTSTLQVQKTSIDLKGIKKYRMSTKKPNRIAETVSFLAGLPLAVCGYLNLISTVAVPYIKINQVYYNPNNIALWAGLVYTAIGLLPFFIDRKSYTIRVTTEDGKTNIVRSHNKEYVMKVMEGLNNAYVESKKKNVGRPKKQTAVSV
jgi:hypothetical protein